MTSSDRLSIGGARSSEIDARGIRGRFKHSKSAVIARVQVIQHLTDRSTYQYLSRQCEQAGLSKRSEEIAETRVLRLSAHPRTREMGLQLRNKTPKRRVEPELRSDRAKA